IKRLVGSMVLVCAVAQAQAAEEVWLDMPQSELVYLQLEQGTVVFKLADQFAPRHTERFRQLVRAGFYQGLTFYRVIDQFVLQAGLPEDEKHPTLTNQNWPGVEAEFSWPVRAADRYTLVQKPEIFAEETGFNQGFAVGRDNGQEWLLSCPLTINMARDNDANSGTTDFALMRGQAPRHLDRNMSVFAKVVWGAELLNLVKFGPSETGGIITDPKSRSRILKASLGSDLAKSAQLPLQWQDTSSPAFAEALTQRRLRGNEFFKHKGNGALDICYSQVPVRLKPL
ncbi:MAG: peptidylprolyl isomerase, partial [Gammaproteobacteria bacterium]|nr:peptidylprolyl isomerase [Gammaproteobacteria bacterium]